MTPTQIQLVGYPAESADAGGQRPRPPYEELFFEGTWGAPLARDEKVVEELKAAGMLQAEGPAPWRAAELRAMSQLFGLPE